MASANAFDFKLFKRLLEFTKPYRLVFYFVAFTALILSGLAILRPYFLERAIDESIIPRDPSGLIYFIVIMIGVLVLEVIRELVINLFTLVVVMVEVVFQKMFKL